MNVLVAVYSRVAVWNLPPAHVEQLRRAFPQHAFLHARNHAEALEHVPQADVLFASNVRPTHITAASRLRWFHTPVAGVGHLLFPELAASDILFTNGRGMSAGTIAEHVVGVTLAMFRKLPQAVRAQAAREWAQDEIATPPACRMIAGSTVLVVGLGAIGTAVAQALSALGARVIGIKRNVPEVLPRGVDAIHTPDRLRSLLPSADVVVLAAAETSETRHMIGREALAAMRKDACLVNVSRGGLIDEGALIDAIAAGHLAGVALDVFEQEPLP
ncbi:MAG TPA: D-2-hydroxyacid dehydrogenase, partial [Vicinamibacterales bacterium]|nr:D-2-hydroxyacid dehydrogenase [Vicinamibacterales bacterium]